MRRHAVAPAFTLIELLVVIAIIAILASLLLISASTVKAKSRAIVCHNNLKQWTTAMQMYVAENDDYLPPEGSPNGITPVYAWYVALPRMMGKPSYHEMPWRTNADERLPVSPFICPANTNRSNGNNLFHYCVNEHLDFTGGFDRPRKLTTFQNVSQMVWMFDNGKRAAVAQQNNVHTNVHMKGAHIGFLDAHVARFRAHEYWDFEAGKGRTNNSSIVWEPNL